jgi:hypothetical protein
MRRLYLGLVLHNHQPVGNYGFVIEHVYQQAYGPMLDALERHPAVRVAIHTSGCLFDWIAEHRPEYMRRLRALCDRGQVEMLTGGYYEPIQPMIPDRDKRGQIRKLTDYIETQFGQRPTGMWLTERVWEPGLPGPIHDAGVRWTLVDDAHFRMVGLRDDQLDGYYVTEDQGKPVEVFAGSQRLRYTIPWSPVEDVIAELRQIAASSGRDAPYVVLGDDGEKFGAWPHTYEHVWRDGWMERFLSAIAAESDWLETMTPGEYARRFQARGPVYLPTASYAEMMEWAMPPDAAAEYHRLVQEAAAEGRDDLLTYLRGGFWRSFLAKYPEANTMHKRGLRIGEKLRTAPSPAARDALWKAQCNCPYWHGVFGGLYLRHIRAAANTNLVRAERLADEAAAAAGVRVAERDFDFDGRSDVLVQTQDVSLMLHPADGGMMSEFDLRRRDHALLDVIARRPETYHAALTEGVVPDDGETATNIHGAVRVKEPGLAALLALDRWRRGGLQEWLLDGDATAGEFARRTAATRWEPAGPWSCRTADSADGAVVRLERAAGGLRVSKQVTVPARGESIAVAYECANEGSEPVGGLFVSEWNLSPPHVADGDDRTAILEVDGASLDLRGAAGVQACAGEFSVHGSAHFGIECRPDEPCDVWHYPVETVSSSEGGLERVFQGVSVSFVRRLDLAPGASCRFGFTWRVVEPASSKPLHRTLQAAVRSGE